MKKKIMLGLLCNSVMLAYGAFACSLPVYQATYTFTGLAHGTVSQTVENKGRGYRIESITDAHKFIFSDKITEESEGALRSNQLLPRRYYARGSIDEKSTQVTFEQDKGQGLLMQLDDAQKADGPSHAFQFKAPIWDNISYPFALQLALASHEKNLVLPVVLINKEHLPQVKKLTFSTKQVSAFATPMGHYDALSAVTEFTIDGAKIEATFWYAPKLDYLLLASQTKANGKILNKTVLTSITMGNGCLVN